MNRTVITSALLLWVMLPSGRLAAQSRPVSDDELLRPTRLGLRMNGTMARGMMTAWMRNDDVWKGLGLSEEQLRQIADATSRRMLDMADEDGEAYRDSFEYLFEVMLSTQGNLKKLGPERAREFGQKMLPLARGGSEFIGGLVEDARPHLTEEQMTRLEEQAGWMQKKAGNFQRRLQHWADGQYQEGENPFDELESNADRPGRDKEKPEQRQARQMAEWELRRISSWEWSRMLAGTAMMFKFDAAQRAKGEAILASYRKKADAVMTPEWRERMIRNRMLYNAQWTLGDVPRAPWLYQLEREYKEATQPFRELTDGFMREIMALPTAQQRADAVESVRSIAEKHGLAFEDTDVALLWLEPQAAPPVQ